jgi:hypothetical protein
MCLCSRGCSATFSLVGHSHSSPHCLTEMCRHTCIMPLLCSGEAVPSALNTIMNSLQPHANPRACLSAHHGATRRGAAAVADADRGFVCVQVWTFLMSTMTTSQLLLCPTASSETWQGVVA